MKYKSLFALAASLLFAVACDESKEFEPQFSFTGDSVQSGIVSVAAEGTSLSFVAQSNISWNITCDQSWVVVTPAKFTPTTDDVVSTNVSVNVLSNEAYDPRNATLTVQAGSTTTVIRINQEAVDVPVYLEVKDKNGNPASKVEEDAEGGDVTFTVFANTTWDANTTNEWITLEKSTSSVKLTIAENTETTPRDGEVVISGEGVESVKIAVKQAGKTLVLEVKDSEGNAVSTLNVEAAGKEVTLSVNSNVTWNVSTTDTWITLEKNDASVKVTVAENETSSTREGSVTFSGEGVQNVTVSVKQARKVENLTIALSLLSASYNSLEFKAVPSDKNVHYFFMCETDGYVSQFSTDEALMKAELEYWEEKYGQTYAQYGFSSYKDLLLNGICNKGDAEEEFKELKPETDYVCYVFAIDDDTLEPVSALYKLAAKTTEKPQGQWTLLGTGKYKEGVISALFGLEAKEIDVEIYQSKTDSKTYAMKNPYGPEMLYNWWFDNTITKDQIVAAEGTVWEETYFEFTVNGSEVTVPQQKLGMYMNLSSPSFQGWPETKSINNGTINGNEITFPSKGMVLYLGTSGYYANINGDFKITAPSSNTKVVKTGNVKYEKKAPYAIKGFDIRKYTKEIRYEYVTVR